MPTTLYDSGAEEEKRNKGLPQTSIVSGIVKNNFDLIIQGKVLVRIPSLDQEIWARMVATGAGNGTGQFHAPNVKDEVLVALVHADPVDAYIIGGMWSTQVRPPIPKVPTDVQTKRVIRTGLTAEIGHQIEFDDGIAQSVTITTSTKQKVVLDKEKIEISATGGNVKITLDLKAQKVSIEAAQIEIGGAKTLSLKLNAQKIDIGNSKSQTTIKGAPIKLN